MDKELEEALLILNDFWDADEDDQQKALEIASRCIRAMLEVRYEE